MSRYTQEFRSTNIEPLDKFLAFLCHGVQVTLHLQGRGSTRKLGTMLALIRHVRRVRFRIGVEIPAALQASTPFRNNRRIVTFKLIGTK